MTFGSLFAGIGGLDLGLERAGFECRWQVEIDPYARRVLAKHWPDVARWDDVRTFPPDVADAECIGGESRGIGGIVGCQAGAGEEDGSQRKRHGSPIDDRGPADSRWSVDLICGGFPCQDISFAGKGAGLAGERSGLWSEFARVIGVLAPRYVLIENVAALLVRGLDQVLGTLASLGYDAEWHCLPATAVGAPHIRDRVFIVAYAANFRRKRVQPFAGSSGKSEDEGGMPQFAGSRQRSGPLSNAIGHGPQGLIAAGPEARTALRAYRAECERGQWARDPADEPESRVGRVAHGVPNRSHRLRALGNAVVPAIPELIGRAILAAEAA